MPSRSRFVTLATTHRPTVTDVESCHLPDRTKRVPLDSACHPFVPVVGDSYVRCRHPVTGVERRCVITGISSVGGSFASVRFFDGDELITSLEPVIVSVSALEPLMYPQLEVPGGEPVPRSKLLLTCPATGLSTAQAARRLAAFGPNIVWPEARRDRGPELLQSCWGLMPCLIWTGVFFTVLRASWTDCAVLLLLQLVNRLVGWREELRTSEAVAALKASLQPHTCCRRNGSDTNIRASALVPGDIVLLCAGSVVPADCELLSGSVEVNTAQVTGEHVPVTMGVGRIALTGCDIVSGNCEAVVFNHGPHTYRARKAARAATATEMAEAGEFQKILARTTGSLTAISLLLVCLVCGLLLYHQHSSLDVASFGVVLLVASVPIAVPVVWRSALAIGARALAQQAGAILTSLCGMERLASINLLCISGCSESNHDTAETIRRAREFGVRVKLIHNVHDRCSTTMLTQLQQRGWRYGLTGHSVEDAALLKAADLGIALHGATDTVHGASDLVLTTNKLVTIVDAIVLSREILQGLLSYVLYRITSSTLLLSFFVITALFHSVMSPGAYNGMSPACQNTYSASLQHQQAFVEPVLLDVLADADKHQQYSAALAQMKHQLCHQQFTLPVTAIVVMTILNDATILSIPYDTVIASHRPAIWRLHEAVLPSTLVGFIAASATTGLFYCGLSANAAGSWFVSLGIVKLPEGNTYDGLQYDWQLVAERNINCSLDVTGIDTPSVCDWSMCSPPEWSLLTTAQQLAWQQPSFCFRYEQLQTMLFLQVSLSTCMAIWSMRSRGSAFRSRLPGRFLLGASVSVMLAASLLAWKWPFAELEPLPLRIIGWTWLYCVGWFCVQDTAKLALYNTFLAWRCQNGENDEDPDRFALPPGIGNNGAAHSMFPPRLTSRGINQTCPVLPPEDSHSSSWSPPPV